MYDVFIVTGSVDCTEEEEELANQVWKEDNGEEEDDEALLASLEIHHALAG